MSRRLLTLAVPLVVAPLVVVATAIGGLVGSAPAITITPSGPTTVDAGTIINYTASVDDFEDDPDPVAGCDPPPGFTATVTTTITCNATDLDGNPAPQQTLTITVNPPPDTTSPSVTVPPSPLTVQATGPGGATVTYAASANDDVDGPIIPACSPPSGSNFALGATLVTCTAQDTHSNAGEATFNVLVQDTIAPLLTLPGSFTVPAAGAMTTVTYSPAPSATDSVAGSPPVTCNPASGSTFPVGATTVNCSASDGTNTATGSFTVTVADAGTPVVTTSGSKTVEATGPNGAAVSYTASASDDVDGGIVPTCDRPSGSTFPLGNTTVTCRATDHASPPHTGSASFTITVRDTTKPVLNVPGELTIKSSDPVPSTAPAVKSWFAGINAKDLVDPAPSVQVGLPASFPLGTTSVPVTATDKAGNAGVASVKVTVSAEQGVAPTSTPTPDLAPPGNVTGVKAKTGNRSIRISWKNPTAGDFDRVEVTRTPGRNGQPESTVYQGKATSYEDKGLTVGTEYRYLLAAYDKSGNHPGGVAVVVVAEAKLLFKPAEGAILFGPTTLRWGRAAHASYYNVQLFFGNRRAESLQSGTAGLKKVWSAWPKQPNLRLQKTWKFQGRKYRLRPGHYHWYVWPGLGERAQGRYGEMIGQSQFTVKTRRR